MWRAHRTTSGLIIKPACGNHTTNNNRLGALPLRVHARTRTATRKRTNAPSGSSQRSACFRTAALRVLDFTRGTCVWCRNRHILVFPTCPAQSHAHARAGEGRHHIHHTRWARAPYTHTQRARAPYTHTQPHEPHPEAKQANACAFFTFQARASTNLVCACGRRQRWAVARARARAHERCPILKHRTTHTEPRRSARARAHHPAAPRSMPTHKAEHIHTHNNTKQVPAPHCSDSHSVDPRDNMQCCGIT